MIRLGALACALAFILPLAAAAQPAPEAVIEGGQISGGALDSGVRAFLGVPFAAPPVGDLRWRAPQPARQWSGVLHADRFAPDCMQPLRARRTNHYYGPQTISEDCLYLNVWAPPAPATRAPVIVWIYGGGFNIGSANTPLYSGEFLAAKGVVYVAVSYRVGPFGFLAHPALSAEGGGASGNYGLLDQIAALQWVQRNIAAFGGDPNNVTIMGQSAGSASVSLLQQSPLARGLFHRAIGMSGSTFAGPLGLQSQAQGEAVGTAFQTALNAANLADMRDAAPDRILAAYQGGMRPLIDGRALTATPEQVFAARQQNDVPVMIGYTANEGFSPVGAARTLGAYREAVAAAYGDAAGAVLALYPARDDAEAAVAANDLSRDSTLASQIEAWAAAQARYGRAPAFAYQFTRAHPYRPGAAITDLDPATAGAYHTSDLPYWLGTLEALNKQQPTRQWADADRELSAQMQDAIIAFATNGDPNITGAPRWPRYGVRDKRVMRFSGDNAPIRWPNAERFDRLRALARPQQPARAAARPRD